MTLLYSGRLGDCEQPQGLVALKYLSVYINAHPNRHSVLHTAMKRTMRRLSSLVIWELCPLLDSSRHGWYGHGDV
jgi:hypothetical protein